VVTSQEKLNELVGGLDDSRVELARLMDRFPLQVHLEPSDIAEVTSKRVLAKAICLLQFVKSIHRTAENIAAALYPSVAADSRGVEVQQALEALLAAHKIRHGDDGYRIPTPVEDDWETQRAGLKPRRAESNSILREIVEKLWEPQPQHTLLNTPGIQRRPAAGRPRAGQGRHSAAGLSGRRCGRMRTDAGHRPATEPGRTRKGLLGRPTG
jgi:hypothetical protein